MGPWNQAERYENRCEEPATAADSESIVFNCAQMITRAQIRSSFVVVDDSHLFVHGRR